MQINQMVNFDHVQLLQMLKGKNAKQQNEKLAFQIQALKVQQAERVQKFNEHPELQLRRNPEVVQNLLEVVKQHPEEPLVMRGSMVKTRYTLDDPPMFLMMQPMVYLHPVRRFPKNKKDAVGNQNWYLLDDHIWLPADHFAGFTKEMIAGGELSVVPRTGSAAVHVGETVTVWGEPYAYGDGKLGYKRWHVLGLGSIGYATAAGVSKSVPSDAVSSSSTMMEVQAENPDQLLIPAPETAAAFRQKLLNAKVTAVRLGISEIIAV